MNNVKINWAPILEEYIEHLEEKYPNIPVRSSFSLIIDDLNNNRIKSRVILKGAEVAAYAYIIESSEQTDRAFVSIGFIDRKYANDERLRNLIDWAQEEVKKKGKFIMMNEIFNGGEAAEVVLNELDFRKLVRDRMDLSLKDIVTEKVEVPSDLLVSGLEGVNVKEYADAEYDAYLGSEDEILFSSTNGLERAKMVESILAGRYGRVISEASKVLRQNGNIVAAILVTDGRTHNQMTSDPMVVDIFVNNKLRKRGIGRYLLYTAIDAMKQKGYGNLHLWVSTGNNARYLYKKVGFVKSDYPEEIFYYLKPLP